LNDIYRHSLPVHLSERREAFKETGQSGTVIKLGGLKDSWDEYFIANLHSQLSYLVSPFGDKMDFNIILDLGIPEYDGVITSDLYLAESLIHVNATLKTVKSKTSGTKYLVNMSVHNEYGKLIGNKVENVSWIDFTSQETGVTPDCGPLEFEMYYYSLGKSIYFDSVISKETKKFIRENYGLRVYRDSFRVFPYGEPSGKGDWVNLGDRAQSSPGGIAQGGWKVNAYQVIGAIHIGRETNPFLVDQTNREGLQDNKSLFDMERFTLSVIERFELAATAYTRKIRDSNVSTIDKAADELEKANLEVSKSRNILGNQLREYGDDTLKEIKDKFNKLESDVINAQKASDDQEKAYKEQAKELEAQKDTLSNLASLGILAVAFGHETTQDANTVVMDAYDLKKGLVSSNYPLNDSQKESLNRLEEKAKFLKGLSAFYLNTIKISKRNRKDVSPVQVADRVFKALGPSLSRQNMDIEFDSALLQDINITAFEIDFESMFINLLTNAIWALEKTPKENRHIKLLFKKELSRNRLNIEFSDSGKGIAEADLRLIFNPTFSTKKSPRGKQIGTGMGLFILKNIVEDHMNGEIDVIARGELGGATFRISLPISVRGASKNAR
jgi:signal transduction histidine kinase